MCLMSVAQLIPLNVGVRLHPVPQAQHARNGSQWVSAEAPLEQVTYKRYSLAPLTQADSYSLERTSGRILWGGQRGGTLTWVGGHGYRQ